MQIGNKIKRLRLENGLTQEELADRCELTKGYISQLERDLTSPAISTLMNILECLGTDLQKFFNEVQEEKIVFTAEDFFVKEDPDENYNINWIIPNAQKKMMEPILLDLLPNGETWKDNPHSGEEFGYVLSGSIILQLGNERHRLKKGECFYYNANRYHSIRNAGKKIAKVLWISTPPCF